MAKDIAQKRYGIHTAHSNTWIYITRRPKITVDRDIIEKRIRICSSIEKRVEHIMCGEKCRNLERPILGRGDTIFIKRTRT